MNGPIDCYTLELEALSEHENSRLPVRAIATNTDDATTAEAWFTKEQTRALLVQVNSEPNQAEHWIQQLEDHRYVDLVSRCGSKVNDRTIFTSQELASFGFNPDELRVGSAG